MIEPSSAREGLTDHAHAAHGLEYRGLHIVAIAERQGLPETGRKQVGKRYRFGKSRAAARTAAGVLLVAAPVAALGTFGIGVVLVERAPCAQGVEQPLLIFRGHAVAELLVVSDFSQQFGDVTVIVRFEGAKALRLAAERLARVQVRVVIRLHERLELHSQEFAVAQHASVMIRQAPRPRVDVEPRIEFALLRESAQFGVVVAAAQRPVAASGAIVVLEHLYPIARFAQLIGGDHSRDTGAEYEHRAAHGSGAQFDRSLVARIRRQTETRHRLVHRRAARRHTDHREQLPPRH